MGPQISGVEQSEQLFVVGAGCRIGEHEPFEFGFPGGPIAGSVSQQSAEIVEVIGGHGIADRESASRMTCFAEQCAESIAQEVIIDCTVADRQRTQDLGEVFDRS